MKRLNMHRMLPWLIAIAVLCVPASAQEQSVKPGINKPYENPDPDKWTKTFEREGRVVYDHRKTLVADCHLKPGMAAGDIGAGTGLFTRMFSKEVGSKGRVYAVDIAKKFVDHILKTCREQGLTNVVGIVCTPDDCGLPPNSIDVAFVCDTYHHLEYPHKVMRSIHQALRPGGRLIVIDFNRIKGVSSAWMMGHVRVGKEGVVKEIVAAGFTKTGERNLVKTRYVVMFQKAADGDSAVSPQP